MIGSQSLLRGRQIGVTARLSRGQSEEGDANRRVWSTQPDPREYKCAGILRSALKGPIGPRVMAAPAGGTESGYAQASANAGPPSRRNRNTTDKRNIPSRVNPIHPCRPSKNVPAYPGANTGASHLRDHGRGSSNPTQPQRAWVSRHLRPPGIQVAHNPPIAAGETCDLASWGEATARCVPQGPRVTHPCVMGRSVC